MTHYDSAMLAALWLCLMLGVFGLLTGAAAVAFMALSLLRPPRMTDGKAVWVLRRLSPGDLELPFEDMRFVVRDARGPHAGRLSIAGWWIPADTASDRCVVLLHGYADAKVGAIAWAPLWHALGFHILVVDLRAHGESDGVYSTGGYFERHDVDQLLNDLRATRPAETRQLMLFGASLGAGVAVATAAARDDVAAVVLDSPYADFTHVAARNMDRLGAPGRVFQRLSVWLAARIARADFAAIRTIHLLPKVPCPIMAIQSEQDALVSTADREAIASAIAGRANLRDVSWSLPATHLLAIAADPEAYRLRLGAFVERAVDPTLATIAGNASDQSRTRQHAAD